MGFSGHRMHWVFRTLTGSFSLSMSRTTAASISGVPFRSFRARFVRRLPPVPSSSTTGISSHALTSPSIRPSLTRRATLFTARG